MFISNNREIPQLVFGETMKRFSFFTSERNRGASKTIRADQVAEFLGARINPVSNFDNDICIYVKCYPPDDCPINSYFDMNDIYPFTEWIIGHPKVKVIVMSKMAQEYISKVADRDDIVLLPQHHCNYLREKREREEICTAGIVGGKRSCEFDHSKLKAMLGDIGVGYIECLHPNSREQVVDFYKEIDIQIVFRPRRTMYMTTSTSLKLANACSFGIPTVAFPERAFIDEFDGCFLPVNTPEEIIKEVKRLREDRALYNHLSMMGRDRAEKYHIEHIAKLYQQL